MGAEGRGLLQPAVAFGLAACCRPDGIGILRRDHSQSSAVDSRLTADWNFRPSISASHGCLTESGRSPSRGNGRMRLDYRGRFQESHGQMNEDLNSHGNNIGKIMVGGSLAIIAILVIYGSVMHFAISSPAVQGQFGDQFGAINAFFSGLAFLGLIVTIAFQTRGLRLQSRDLRLQTEALRLQIKEFSEQKEEMKRSAVAQEMANQLKAIEMWSVTRRMSIDVAIKNAESEPTGGQRRLVLQRVEERIKRLENNLMSDLAAIGFRLSSSNETNDKGDRS